NMRSLTTFFLMVWLCIAPASLAQAQSKEPADKNDSAATSATKEEVEQLRSEVAAQRQTIEELKAMVQQLAEANGKAGDGAHLVNATLVEPVEPAQAAKPADKKPAEKKKSETPVVAGWSGEHFF